MTFHQKHCAHLFCFQIEPTTDGVLFFAELPEWRTRFRCPSMRYFSYLLWRERHMKDKKTYRGRRLALKLQLSLESSILEDWKATWLTYIRKTIDMQCVLDWCVCGLMQRRCVQESPMGVGRLPFLLLPGSSGYLPQPGIAWSSFNIRWFHRC